MKNNFLKQQIYEEILRKHDYINDIYLSQNVEKDYIITKILPQNVTISCSLLLVHKNINDIMFEINVDNQIATIAHNDHDKILKMLILKALNINKFGTDDKISDDFDVFFIKNQINCKLKNEKILARICFSCLDNNAKIQMKFLSNGRFDIKDKTQVVNLNGENFFYYGGVKCNKNETNYEQMYVKFYIKNNRVYKKFYKYSELKTKFSGVFNTNYKQNFYKKSDIDVHNVSDLNAFLRQGGLKIYLKYKDDLNQNYNNNDEKLYEYESCDVVYLSNNNEAISIKFKLKSN